MAETGRKSTKGKKDLEKKSRTLDESSNALLVQTNSIVRDALGQDQRSFTAQQDLSHTPSSFYQPLSSHPPPQATPGSPTHWINLPAAAIGYAGFTPAHFHHYHDLQRLAFIGKASPTDMNTLFQYATVIRTHSARDSVQSSPFYPIHNGGGDQVGHSHPQAVPQHPELSADKRQSHNQSSESTSPSSENPPHKRRRLPSTSRQAPPSLPNDQGRPELPKSIDDPENTPLSAPVDPSLPSSAFLTKPQTSPSLASKSAPRLDQFKDPSEKFSSNTMVLKDTLASSSHPSRNAAPNPPSASLPSNNTASLLPASLSKPEHQRSLRISLLAQTLLSSERNDTRIPLSHTSLRSFLASLDPTLPFLAEPLHSADLKTVEILGQFVAFEISTRIEMVVMACRDKDVKIKEEHLEALEAAIERGREKDWN